MRQAKTSGKVLAAILVMQVMILLGQWFGGFIPQARAQVPDAGAQRLEIVNQLKDMNAKMDKLISILDGGKLQVQVAKPDESKEK